MGETNYLKFLGAVCLVVVLIGLALTTAWAQPATTTPTATTATPPITLRLATSWPTSFIYTADALQFVDKINIITAGRLEIKYVGGPETIPASQLGQALKSGVIDVAYMAPVYAMNLIPETYYGNIIALTPAQEREKGLLALWEKIYAQKLNAFPLAKLQWGPRINFFLNKKITTPTLSGLKIRGGPDVEPIVKDLGGTWMSMPMGDIYNALDRGIVDGFSTSVLGLPDYGLQNVVKYCLDEAVPGVLDSRLLVNLNKWNSLPQDLRGLILAAVPNGEQESAGRMKQYMERDRQKCIDAGMEFFKFTNPADAQTFADICRAAQWRYGAKVAPDYLSDFKTLLQE